MSNGTPFNDFHNGTPPEIAQGKPRLTWFRRYMGIGSADHSVTENLPGKGRGFRQNNGGFTGLIRRTRGTEQKGGYQNGLTKKNQRV
jgi:hypothetical protein